MTVLLCKFSSTYNSPTKFSDSFCIYSSNDFDNMPPEVRKVNRSGNAVVKVIGQSLPRLADWTIRFEGEWKHSKGYGYTFFASHYELLTPSTLKGITRFLASKTFPGVGIKTAASIEPSVEGSRHQYRQGRHHRRMLPEEHSILKAVLLSGNIFDIRQCCVKRLRV